MREEMHAFHLPEGVFNVEATRFEENDRKNLAKMYRDWRSLSDDLRSHGGRGVNLPEVISEGCFALEMNVLRVVNSISGANSSWDCYNPVSHKRIQVKACSVLPDLTSFGPKSEWDEIYFLDFYREGNWDGTFDIYKIPNDLIYNHKVNQHQTMREQQLEKRRPRFSIFKEIIRANEMRPIKTGHLGLH
tara:strand:- start:306 stop:872 length:567 start_codon:yes stop_codon:yes gene_type:complete